MLRKHVHSVSKYEPDHVSIPHSPAQAKRGGHVQLGPINPPQMDYKHDKGDALYSLELTVGFEKVGQQHVWL